MVKFPLAMREPRVRFPAGVMGCHIIASWRSMEARRSHKPKVRGSNPLLALFHIILECYEIFCICI